MHRDINSLDGLCIATLQHDTHYCMLDIASITITISPGDLVSIRANSCPGLIWILSVVFCVIIITTINHSAAKRYGCCFVLLNFAWRRGLQAWKTFSYSCPYKFQPDGKFNRLKGYSFIKIQFFYILLGSRINSDK